MAFVATINVPGYLPMDDEPPVFDTAREAWQYLWEEREREEDSAEFDSGDPHDLYSETWATLQSLALGYTNDGLGDLPGVIYGDTPGYHGDHDLGLAYVVSVAEEED